MKKIYHDQFPGYFSTKNGPQRTEKDLNEAIVAVTGLANALNHNFFGDIADENLFAGIIRGKLRHWCIWESETHVAFLAPLGIPQAIRC